ncbi:hypothetical protein [Synechocystis sp. PCC 7509]|uniref:hypothetical protein n=1 Tax=Synechocystis sp. PCC 7509 TaxID=927677 RepID=UPI0002ACC40E|nr:hypothetical protein [Synechocystis sp. PCC 7509]
MSNDIPLPSDIRYGYGAFIDDLKALEEVYYPSSMDRKLTPSIIKQYYALLERVKNYANYGKKLSEGNKVDNLENRDIVILNYVHSTILSRLNQLKSNNLSDLVIDILGFIKIIESNIKSLTKQQQIEKIDFYKKGYNSQIKQKIQESNSFIKQLQETIEQYNQEIDRSFEKLINEIEELKKDGEKNKEELIKKKEELEAQLPLKIFFGSLKVLTSLFAFAGPQGAVAAGLLDSISNTTEGFVLQDSKGNKLPIASIPEGAKTFIKGCKDYSKGTKEEIEKITKERIKEITDILADHPKGLSGKIAQLQIKGGELKLEIEQLSKRDDTGLYFPIEAEVFALNNKIKQLNEELGSTIKEEKTALKDDTSPTVEHAKFEKWLDKAEKLINVANAGINIYNTIKDSESAIDEINQAILKNQESIKKLNDFKDIVNSYSQETITNMKGDVTNLENSLKNKSHIALDVSKWQIQAHLKDIKHQLDEMTSGFKTHGAFIHIFEKMSDAIATLVGIYDRIENYQEQAQLVDYIANVNSAGVTVDYPEVNELKIIILQNTILERYSTLISAVKQWAFPFADKFFSNFNFMLNIDAKQDILENATSVTKIIDSLKEKVEIYNATITEMDTKIVKTSFGLNDSVIPPFFTWKGSQYADAINILFKEGSNKKYESEVVTLISSVQGSYYYAVKFNKIELRIKHLNSKKQQELNSCLDNFNVYLTHSTDSYYKFNNIFYKFGSNIDVNSNNKLELMYGFKKDRKEHPYTKNEAYEKLDNGQLMLSPYSVWQVKLALANPGNGKNSFNDLEKYSGFVNLELVGTGSYVDEENMTDEDKSSLLLNFYYQYQADDMVPIIGGVLDL